MTSISSIMSTSLSALQAQQQLINIANSNVSNANTEGYSRVTGIVSATYTTSSPSDYNGAGVEVADVKRVTDAFTLKQLCSANTEAGELEAELEYLEGIEAIFDESEGSGLSDALSEFFNAWSDLANDPTGATERSVLLADPEALVSTLNDMYEGLQEIRVGIIDDISGTTGEINNLTGQIADLNKKILEAESKGLEVNTCLDEREALLTELSSLIDIAYYEDDSGQLNIQLSNGKTLVKGSTANELSATTTTITLTGAEVTGAISGGALGGQLEGLNAVQGYLDDLDALAAALIDQVNALHTTGYDANGVAGTALFSGTGASNIAVNITDTALIAAATDTDSSAIAIAIAELQETNITINGKSSTFEEYDASLVSKIGAEVSSIGASYSTQSDLVTYYENYRESVSGVSIDEELANIILYQNAYEASAKIISVLDELLETIIAM
jgi:flagellar hook-associated protein 1 FlgK